MIWGEDRYKFPQPPEECYRGKQMAVCGLITEYEGVAEVQVYEP